MDSDQRSSNEFASPVEQTGTAGLRALGLLIVVIAGLLLSQEPSTVGAAPGSPPGW